MTDKQRKALENEALPLDTALEFLRQHHEDSESGDDFDFDAALTIKRAQNEIARLRQALTEPAVPDATEEMVERIGWDGFTLRDLRHVLQVVSESCEPDAETAVPDAPDDYILTAAYHADWLLRSDSEWHRTVGAAINKILKERREPAVPAAVREDIAKARRQFQIIAMRHNHRSVQYGEAVSGIHACNNALRALAQQGAVHD